MNGCPPGPRGERMAFEVCATCEWYNAGQWDPQYALERWCSKQKRNVKHDGVCEDFTMASRIQGHLPPLALDERQAK